MGGHGGDRWTWWIRGNWIEEGSRMDKREVDGEGG